MRRPHLRLFFECDVLSHQIIDSLLLMCSSQLSNKVKLFLFVSDRIPHFFQLSDRVHFTNYGLLTLQT